MARSFTSSFTVLAAFGVLAAVPAVVSARPQSFHFEFTSPGGNAYGDIFTTTDNLNGTYTATSGRIVVLDTPIAGSYNLVFSSVGFTHDELLSPSNTSVLTSDGIVFSDGVNDVTIWGNGGANNYSFWSAPVGTQNWVDYSDAGTFVLTAVPTPGSVAMLGLGGVMAFGRRRRA